MLSVIARPAADSHHPGGAFGSGATEGETPTAGVHEPVHFVEQGGYLLNLIEHSPASRSPIADKGFDPIGSRLNSR